MSTLFVLPFVKSKDASEIYEKFNPFPRQHKVIAGLEKTLTFLSLGIVYALFAGLSGDSRSVAYLLGLVSVYGAICFAILFWKLRLEYEKRVLFVEHNPHLLRFLFPK